MTLIFACVHVASKIEEAHELTLDRLLEAAGFGDDASLKAKVSGLELPLLEGLGFVLLVEPKPDSALRMLAQELRESRVWCAALDGMPPHSRIADESWDEVVVAAESLVWEASIHTDAILRYPASVVIAGALSSVLGRYFSAMPHVKDSPAPGVLLSILGAGLDSDRHRETIQRAFLQMIHDLSQLSNIVEVTEEAVKEPVQRARRCHRAFDRLREEVAQRREANRLERKRRWGEMKGAVRRQVATPLVQGFAELARRIPELDIDGADDFVIHRPSDDRAAHADVVGRP